MAACPRFPCACVLDSASQNWDTGSHFPVTRLTEIQSVLPENGCQPPVFTVPILVAAAMPRYVPRVSVVNPKNHSSDFKNAKSSFNFSSVGCSVEKFSFESQPS